MAAILQTKFSMSFCFNQSCISIQISLMCVPKGLINKEPSLIQSIEWATSYHFNRWWPNYWRIHATRELILLPHQLHFTNCYLVGDKCIQNTRSWIYMKTSDVTMIEKNEVFIIAHQSLLPYFHQVVSLIDGSVTNRPMSTKLWFMLRYRSTVDNHAVCLCIQNGKGLIIDP